jgi:hypothetical protein
LKFRLRLGFYDQHLRSTMPQLTLARILRPTADIFALITTRKVHSTLFPYPWAPTLHAARYHTRHLSSLILLTRNYLGRVLEPPSSERISAAFQSILKRNGNRLNWRTYMAGFLVMVCLRFIRKLRRLMYLPSTKSWGSMLISHFILQLPPPILYNIHPWINYLGVHVILTVFFHFFPDVRRAI